MVVNRNADKKKTGFVVNCCKVLMETVVMLGYEIKKIQLWTL